MTEPNLPAFYALPMEEQTARLGELAAEALRAWSISKPRVDLVKYRENVVFSAITPDGSRFALRIHRPGFRSDTQIRSEIAWMRSLGSAGVQTPEIVPTTAGDVITHARVASVPETRQCDLLRWVPGDTLGTLELGVAGDDESLAAIYRTLGETAARVHDHGVRWKRPDDFERPPFDLDALVGEAPAFGPFWKLDCLTAEQLGVLFEARDRVRERLLEFGTTDDRFGLIHGDFLPENVLVFEGKPLLIDFDDCGNSWYAFELATGLFPLLPQGRSRVAMEGYVEGYRALRAFPEEWIAMLPTFLVARTLSYLGWPVGRPENEDAREIAPFLAGIATDLCSRYLAGEAVGVDS